MFIAVSSAFQFAGIIHWISLDILSVFFSEVGKDWGPGTSVGQLLPWGDQALFSKYLLASSPLLALKAAKREKQYRELSSVLGNGTGGAAVDPFREAWAPGGDPCMEYERMGRCCPSKGLAMTFVKVRLSRA